MSKKKNNEEKEVKTQAEKQEEKETEATDKAEKNAEENPLEKELKDTKEQLLRVTAEYSNFRKRSEKEKNESFAFATIKAVSEILATVDNLERAIASEQEDYEGLKKGVQMTYDGLMASLEKLGVTARPKGAIPTLIMDFDTLLIFETGILKLICPL